MLASPLLSVVVPAYEAERRLLPLLLAIDKALFDVRYELIVVDDASKDRTWDILSGSSEEIQHIKALRLFGLGLKENVGQHKATLLGLLEAKGSYIATLDDDLQHDPKALPLLLHQLQTSGSEAIYATYPQDQGWGSQLLSTILRLLNVLPEARSSFRLLSAHLVHRLRSKRCSYVFLEALIASESSQVSRLPLRRGPRYEGRSNYNFYRRLCMALCVLQGFTHLFVCLGALLSVLMIASPYVSLEWVGLVIAIATLYAALHKIRSQKSIEDHVLSLSKQTTHPIHYHENNISRYRIN